MRFALKRYARIFYVNDFAILARIKDEGFTLGFETMVIRGGMPVLVEGDDELLPEGSGAVCRAYVRKALAKMTASAVLRQFRGRLDGLRAYRPWCKSVRLPGGRQALVMKRFVDGQGPCLVATTLMDGWRAVELVLAEAAHEPTEKAWPVVHAAWRKATSRAVGIALGPKIAGHHAGPFGRGNEMPVAVPDPDRAPADDGAGERRWTDVPERGRQGAQASLMLVYDAETATPPMPGLDECWAVPSLWLPNGRIPHGTTIIGVKWCCERCGFEGPAQFGPANSLGRLALFAEVGSFPAQQTAGCPSWQDAPGVEAQYKRGLEKGFADALEIEHAIRTSDEPRARTFRPPIGPASLAHGIE